jgi:PAS domain S-box-containing protein
MFNSSNHSITRGGNPIKNKSLRVLIIDDSENDALLIISALKKGGYNPLYERVETAASMKKSLREKRWDVILCDYKMPKFNAPLAISLLKKKNIDTPVIIISGVTGEEKAVECMRLGARDYIIKDNLYRLCPAIAGELTEAKNRKKQKKKEEDERKKIGEALRKSELSFRSLFESSPVGIFKVADRKFLEVNPAFCRTTGYSPEDLIGQSVRICYRDDEEYERAGRILYSQVLRKGKKFVEVHLNHKKGAQFDAVLYLNLIDPRDHYAGYEGIMIDITEHRRMETKLLENEERLRGITQNMPGFIYQFYAKDDGKYGISYVNGPGMKDLGITENPETLFQVFFSRIHEEDRDRFLASIKTAVETRTCWNFEGRFYTQSAGMIWFQGLSTPKRKEDQLVFDGILLDITKRKQAERKLLENDERLRGITQNMPGFIFQFYTKDDGEYGISYVNGRLAEFLEITANLDALPQVFFSRIHREDKDRCIASIKTAVDKRTSWNIEFRIVMRSGEICWFHGMATPVQHKDKQVFTGILLDITERKQAEEKFHKIFMTTPDCIAITRMKDGLILDVNMGFDETTGWNGSNAIGRTSYEINFWNDTADRDYMLNELKSGRDIMHREFEFRQSDGSVRFGIYSARSIKIDGEACLIFILRDVSERKKAEESLFKSEKKFSSIFHLNPNPMVITEIVTGKMVDVNQAFTHWSGYFREEVIGVSVLDIDIWANQDDREKTIVALTESGEVNGKEVILRCKNGNLRNVLLSCRFVEIEQERYLLTLIHDITERKQVEEKYRSIFENAQEGIFRSLPEGRFIMANQSMARILGYESPEDLIAGITDIPRQLYVDPDDRAKIIDMMERQGLSRSNEVRFYRKDGSMIWVSMTIMPTRDEKGQVIYYEGIIEDITDRKRADEEIRRTEEQMRAFAARLQTVREEERTHIAREIHDELGRALTGLKIDFSLLTKAAGEIKEELLKHSMLDQMHDTMKNIDKTIRTVRKIATELRPGILDDLGILAALEWQLNDFHKHTGIRCEWISSLEEIHLDEQETTALFRIFQETLTNIARHADATGVRVHLRKKANTCVLDVEDNGRGITKNNIDDKRSLGLLGMRERTLAFGGRIEVKGQPGRGTTVTVEIPVK